ncbi:hypothetical protein P872_09275 [Rhodonellum psychrophilum GCM71 = DSM 17998]|uniref:Glycosyl transferase family 1 domain-containing protein n=2 Tax=Rhodonellum TaxID=336827 RepID=U5BY24_9BACT|nr:MULTISPECIES: glycosyltransferase [Rhodonellum]ERM81536.1 hypothetical protein P872_09275 [Rhodonellum psychrophilum GCM71 = DSM 17998]SDZ40577.1 Glycosyltransferase involved in cell wall bisynthesis [Rhodonellum ikkaensis]
MKVNRHIVFIIPSLQQGGLENSVSVLVNQLTKDNNHRISIICFYKNSVFYKVDKSVEIIHPNFHRKGFSTVQYYLKSFFFIKNTLKDIKPDVVISFGDYINAISILTAKSLGLPVYISDRSSPGKNFPFFVNLLRNIAYPKAKGVIAQTQRAKDQKVKMGVREDKIKVIPNPVRRISILKEPKRKIVLCVARHYKVKGIDRLFEAFANTHEKSWQLEIAGSEGPETKYLKELAENLNISERVTFLGARKDIDAIYSYSGIFALTSRSEGFPNALIEAMAHGLPCIAFDINAGPADIIKHEVNGILVEDGNIGELTLQLNLLMEDTARRNELGKRALKIMDRLSLERISEDFLAFISR